MPTTIGEELDLCIKFYLSLTEEQRKESMKKMLQSLDKAGREAILLMFSEQPEVLALIRNYESS